MTGADNQPDSRIILMEQGANSWSKTELEKDTAAKDAKKLCSSVQTF
jgi:hypothetical protein